MKQVSTIRTGVNIGLAILLVTAITKFQPPIKQPVKAEPQVIEKIVYKEPETPEEYIKYVFGEDAPKAFLLLKGKSGGCAENKNLKWDAQNYNKDKSVDIGIFQINSRWQKVQPKFLYNWKTNINIAHQLYVENGNSFKLWTCGKVYGI